MNGLTRMVIMRSLSSFILRVAIMAGTLQPKPIIMGMKEWPQSPSLDMRRSIRNAALAR
ncbi:MAG: hypothetical protein A4E47_01229 [Methanosaeta sp. PtaU1.Bin028]|nr:MAG: hypothetical protein A4E47_01229 [Methanosaeta sp. PtaU1.Bin028]